MGRTPLLLPAYAITQLAHALIAVYKGGDAAPIAQLLGHSSFASPWVGKLCHHVYMIALGCRNTVTQSHACLNSVTQSHALGFGSMNIQKIWISRLLTRETS